jgi:para-aminobenzoate synthetase component 1
VEWHGEPLAAWIDELTPRGDTAGEAAATHGWDGFAGGCFVQLDYESPATAPRAWRVESWAEWDRDGRCALRGPRTADLARDLTRPERDCAPAQLRAPLAPAWPESTHADLIARALAYIAAGDVYQVNLTVPFAAAIAPRADADIGTFLALATASPAPFAAFLRAPGRESVVSHSPECFLRLRSGRIASFPIKGTRRRVAGEEPRVRAELLASPKDRAELAMIVDLVRNDLGRVAEPGSVAVLDPARVMDLPYAHHLVASVAARLRAGLGVGDAVAAAFPAGSITGAPKRRAMAIIAELERRPRGPYCGSFGWIGPGGCDLAVAIRTVAVGRDIVRLHAGGGIVADSDPRAEWEEACLKASAMARAVGGRI